MTGNLETLVERIRQGAADMAEAALREAVSQMRSGERHLAQVERRVGQEIRPIAAAVLEAALETMGNGKDRCMRPCKCGGAMRYVSDRTKTLQTLGGPAQLRRAYYHCSNCGHGEFPLDAALGVEGTSLTPGVQEVVAWADAELAFGRAAEFLERTMGLVLSKDTHETLSAQLGQAAEPGETHRAERASEALPPAEQFYVTCDGVKVNTQEGWKEPKLGAVFRATLSEEGQPVRGPTRYVGHLEKAEPFGERLWRLAEAAGVGQARSVIVLGDGAPWIWNLADFHFPGAVQIVDFYHAVERLSEVARRIFHEEAAQVRAWLGPLKSALQEGNVAGVLRALKALRLRGKEQRELVRKAIGYFTENRQRMRYNEFRAKGYFIGSGVVEAGCKHVIAQRFKQSGMRWSIQGFTRLLHLRLCILNGDWDDFARSRFPRLANLPAAYF